MLSAEKCDEYTKPLTLGDMRPRAVGLGRETTGAATSGL